MKYLFYIFIYLFNVNLLHAQSEKGIISGKVTDNRDMPLSGVYITVKETNTGTVTDEKGNYILKIQIGKYDLDAHALGYGILKKTVVVKNDETSGINFILSASSVILKEATVLGVKVKSPTATRTMMQIQDIPQAIAIIGQRVINQQAAFDLTTIVRNISGLNFSGNYSGAGSAQFFNARGFDLNDSQNYRWNGMMIWNFGNNYSDNIEQVEFLKGPASILFGDVSPGGIMNFVTKKPLAEFSASTNFKTGSWGLVRPAVDITGPLTKDRKLRFRLNTSFEKSKSFRDNVSSQREFIAPSVAWDITSKLSLNVEAVFKHSRSTDDAGLVSPNGKIDGLKMLDPRLYLGESALNYLYKSQNYYTRLEYELSKTWRLRATGFYGNIVNRPFGLWFDQPVENGDFARRQYGFNQKSKNGSVSIDIFGTFYTGLVKHNILAGTDYQSTRYRNTNAGELSLLDTINIFHPVHSLTPIVEPAESLYRPYVSLISRTGFFFQDQAMFFNEKLHVLFGLRAGRTRQGNHYYESKLAGTVYEGYTDNIISKFVLTPRIGIVYKPRPWTSFYASFSKGYEINSPDIFAKNYKEFASPPATLSNQLEFGSKTNFLEDNLGITLSLFQIDKHNPYGYVYLDQQNPNYDEYNVYYWGHHRSRGIELDADGKISSVLSVTAGAAFTRTKVVKDLAYPAGNLLPNAPKLTGNIWLNYEPSNKWKGISAGAGFFYKGNFFSGIANNPDFEIPRSYTLDLALGYKFKVIGIQLNAMNVTNRISYLNPWQFNLFDVKPLRQLIVTLSYKIDK